MRTGASQLNERRDYIWNSVVPADLVLLAGLLAYFANVIGAQGPMVLVGHADANRAAAGAWLQIPLHLGVAALLVLGAPTRRPYLRQLGGAMLAFLWVFALMSVTGVLLQLKDYYADVGDLGIASAIFACYTAAAYFAFRGAWQRVAPAEPASSGPELRAMDE